eukprot:Blabericola_migrator_1__4591@NODE_2438_length_2758_cov_743_254924_g1467_i2_p2_GENE_NODE_2438_length_2758_cov_743_254924_g1467_i2NODE_2438_length_2758_cov_743_254924_g1467_i2_p2_ORF_typecomplete_len134_score16_41Gly_kinase/PF02595_15/0_21_NODE_2438_length_2758_cov_743_254924_g1467_i213561757
MRCYTFKQVLTEEESPPLRSSRIARPRDAEVETNREIAAASRCHFQMAEISSQVFTKTGELTRAKESVFSRLLPREPRCRVPVQVFCRAGKDQKRPLSRNGVEELFAARSAAQYAQTACQHSLSRWHSETIDP